MNLGKLLFAFVLLPAALAAQNLDPSVLLNPPNDTWPTYNGDYTGRRFSALTQINSSNVGGLQMQWIHRVVNSDIAGFGSGIKSTPLMVNGVIYSTGGTRRAAFALDAATGEMIWMHSEREGARGAAAPRQLSGRGLAYWTDGAASNRDERILYVTPGYRLFALNAKTGVPTTNGRCTRYYVTDHSFDVLTDGGSPDGGPGGGP